MRIHTSVDQQVIENAAKIARVDFIKYSVHGSRKRPRAFEVTLTGESGRNSNGGRYGGDNHKAATWDQWGVFLAAIYESDPDAWCWAYADADDFHYRTDERFADGWPTDAHGDHRWEIGVPYRQTCRYCTASKNWGPA